MKLLILLSFLVLVNYQNCEKIDYFWKEYSGEIPDEAFPGGTDQTHKSTFIGQVYLPSHGIQPTTIINGEKIVTASRLGVHKSDQFIKILCTNSPENFSWIPTTSASIAKDTNNTHLVIGGTENGKILYIGRIFYEGMIIIGKVCAYNVGNAQLYFPYKDKEISATSYEVLTYSNV